MMMALEHGKAVICEKSFTMNAEQAKRICAFAAEKGIFVEEAIWTRYMPSRRMINDILKRSVIGRPDILTAEVKRDGSL